jgi:organic hydroperoxide reductase OsmC/OhrA
MHLVTQGQVPGMSDAGFKQYAAEAEKKCPVSISAHRQEDHARGVAAALTRP